MNKVFVTGAAGFIGSNLVDRLLKDGYKVVGWDNLSTGRIRFIEEALKNPNFTLIQGDNLNVSELSEAMKTHLIDVENDGIWSNDFITFYNNRLTEITNKLSSFIIPQDTTGQALEVYEDVEEVEEETNEINID